MMVTIQEAYETSLAAHVALCKEPRSNAQEQASEQHSTTLEPYLIGPVLQPEVTPVEVPVTGTHNTATSTENTQNAIKVLCP